MIDLIIDLQTVSFDAFVQKAAPFSIALDGYVYGGPRFHAKGPHASFNHHEEVDRLATRSTCAQVLMSLRQGLFTRFRKDGNPTALVHVNDCDEDVCLAWTLLKHHYLAEGSINPILNRLVAMEDALDCTAGAYPFPKDLPALREMAWVFEPYRQFRSGGMLDKRDPSSYRSVISDVEHRILQHIAGRGHEVPLDTRYEVVGGGTGWSMVREKGAQARTGMFSDGIRTFVAVRDRGDNRYTYTIGKMSPFNSLDLVALTERLNDMEGGGGEYFEDEADYWGGGNMIIGSPRMYGSKLTLDQITQVMNEALHGL